MPVAFPALAAPGAPTELCSELSRPSAPSAGEPTIEDDAVDYGVDADEDPIPEGAAAAGEGSQQAADVVKDCWDI